MSKPVSSSNVKTNNVVLQVTVPKRTGVKRRRGMLDPYDEAMGQQNKSPSATNSIQSEDSLRDINDVLRSLRDNAEKYEIQPIGCVVNTHRFRSMTTNKICRLCEYL